MLGGLGSLFGGIAPVLSGANNAVKGVLDTVAPGSLHGGTLTGNIVGNNGITDDLINGIQTGDVTGAISNIYADVIGHGGIVENLADGYGLGVEGLLGNVLGTADGLLGTSGGLLDGIDGGLLG
jgi:hypothetical protein